MSNEQEFEQIEISIEQAHKQVNLMKALHRLHQNKDFKSVILDGYFKDEASRVVLLKADDSTQSDEDQRLLSNCITSIGGLAHYLRTISMLGNMSEKSLEADEQTREELSLESVQ